MPLGPLLPGAMVGPYRIVCQVGEGGMGMVFLAVDHRLGREVALKVLSSELSGDPVARERLLREARAASRLNHPNVVAIHDIGETDGDVYLVLEYVDGEPLSAILGRGPMPIPDILRIGRQVAMALEAAHARGVVHRDIKPANVLVARNGDVKVVDFGLAVRVPALILESSPTEAAEGESRLTRTGYAAGTVAYMSPEQVRGEAPDGRSDLFALGVVLYEAATGRLPFAASSVFATAAAIMNDRHESVRALRPDAPAGLVEILDRCLEKDPPRRPPSGTAVVEALRLLEAGQSTHVVRHALGVRRLSPKIIAAAVVAVVAVAAIAGLTAAWTLRDGPRPRVDSIAHADAQRLHAQSESYAARGTNRANLTNAADLARRGLALEPGNATLQAHLAHMLARLQFEDQDPAHTAQIEALVKDALASNEDLAEAWFARAWSLMWNRDFAGTLRAAERGRQLAPKDWAGYALAGRALVRLGRVEEGLSELRRSLETEGGHIFGRAMLGYELAELMRLDEAAAEFSKVLEYQPDHPGALNNLASLYLMTGRYLDSVPLYQRLLATQPDAAPASNLGTAFYYLDMVPDAIRAYERAIEMEPHNPEYERNLADAHDRQGNVTEARRWYAAALEDCERRARDGTAEPATRILHAVLLGRLGRPDEALREADALLREGPENVRTVYAAAQVNAMAGRRQQTFALVRSAIALGYPREEFRRDPYFGTLLTDREFLDLLVE